MHQGHFLLATESACDFGPRTTWDTQIGNFAAIQMRPHEDVVVVEQGVCGVNVEQREERVGQQPRAGTSASFVHY